MLHFHSIVLVLFYSLCEAQEGPLVDTTYGTIQGLSLTLEDGRPYEVYRGIPYATPPVGDLRWQKPQPHSSWEGVRNATEYGPVCHQLFSLSASEDCLHLNVFVPESVEDHLANPLPVVVYIHGGAFIIGRSSEYDSREVTIEGRIIVVTINYRLSTLGFLSTGTEAAPGNYGLWDQILALQWVNQNIAQFGGDVSRITIMGLSAGGASVSHLALSPQARGLFHRVIAMSGSAASYFGLTYLQPFTTSNLAAHYNCSLENETLMMDCLREQSAFSLALLGVALPVLQQDMFFNQVPVIDGNLVSKHPLDAMKEGLNTDFDFIIGRTMHDGADYALPFTATKNLTRLYTMFAFNCYENRDEMVDLFYERYPGLGSDDLDTRQRVSTQASTDFVFGARSFLETGFHNEQTGDTRGSYYYLFNYRYLNRSQSWLEGIHSEDISFFFGDVIGRGGPFDANDTLLCSYIRAYYCNFAYSGNPNEGPHEVPVTWPQFDFSSHLQLVERLEPEVQPVSQANLDEYDFINNVFYSIAIPRKTPVVLMELLEL